MNGSFAGIRAVIIAILSLLALAVWLPQVGTAAPAAELRVTFLNVGQGDAILIETPDGIEVLIDGGPNGAVLREIAAVLGAFDRTIDMVVATHPDADHIGGLVDVLERYDIETIMLTENESSTAVNDAFQERVRHEDATLVYARAGQTYALGASTTMMVLFPEENPADLETNESSIVLKLSYGATDVLLTGDAPKSTEAQLIERFGQTLESEVLKLGHHGSRTSTGEEFLAAVQPEYGIISAGRDNRYGHPHAEVLDALQVYGVVPVSTAAGRVTLVTDGHEIDIEQ